MHRISPFLGIAIAILIASPLTAQQPADSNSNEQSDQVDRADDGRDGIQANGHRKAKLGEQQPGKRSMRKPQVDPESVFKRLDRNRDGILTVDEVPERLQQRLKTLDVDSDGMITKQEFSTAIRKRMMSERSRTGKSKSVQDPADGNNPAEQMRQRGEQNPAIMLDRLDRDRDGKLSLGEVPERMKEKFDRIDSNGDSLIDPQELTSAVERLKAGMEKGRYGTDPEKSKGQAPKRPPGDSSGKN